MGVQRCNVRIERFHSGNTAEKVLVELAAKWFSIDIEKEAGRFTRGKNKGKLRGWIIAAKVLEGGWHHGIGGVLRPNMIFARFSSTFDEMANLGNLTTAQFITGAKRVDTAYGHVVDTRTVAQMEADAYLERATSWLKEQIETLQNGIALLNAQHPGQAGALNVELDRMIGIQAAGGQAVIDWFKAPAPQFAHVK